LTDWQKRCKNKAYSSFLEKAVNITKQPRLGFVLLGLLLALIILLSIRKSDPFAPFVTECEASYEFEEKKFFGVGVGYSRVLNYVEKAYILSPDGKLHEICTQMDTGAKSFTIDRTIAEALGLMRREGKVKPIKSSNGRVKRDTYNATIMLGGELYHDAVITVSDRAGLGMTYAANAGTDYMRNASSVHPAPPKESGKKK
jgi:predicted aspartyl protease